MFLYFQDSTLGLVSPDEENLGESVQNYKTLFSNLEICVQGSSSTAALSTSLLIMIIISLFTSQIMY